MSKDTSGPAFPESMGAKGPFGGLTKRQWYAGQALQGWHWSDLDVHRITRGEKVNYAIIAETCFKMADAIIEADMATLPQVFLPYMQIGPDETVYSRFEKQGFPALTYKES